MTRKELTPGYWHVIAGASKHEKLFKFEGWRDKVGDSMHIKGILGIKVSFEINAHTPDTIGFSEPAIYTPATPEQIEWLKACIFLGKYIPFEETRQEFIFSI